MLRGTTGSSLDVARVYLVTWWKLLLLVFIQLHGCLSRCHKTASVHLGSSLPSLLQDIVQEKFAGLSTVQDKLSPYTRFSWHIIFPLTL